MGVSNLNEMWLNVKKTMLNKSAIILLIIIWLIPYYPSIVIIIIFYIRDCCN